MSHRVGRTLPAANPAGLTFHSCIRALAGPGTHDSTVARRAQRIGVMKNGRLSFRQPARDLTAERLQPPDLETADSVLAGE